MGPDMMGDHGMMGGHGIYAMMFWMPVGLLLSVVLLVGIVWLVMHWLNKSHMPMMPSISSPQDSYPSYEQGYRPRQPMPDTYQEGERDYHVPQSQQDYTRSQIELEYPQLEMPWQQSSSTK